MFFKKRKYQDIEELVAACQKSDRQAQTIFYDRYKSKMLAICCRYARTAHEAEDIFQEAFVKVFRDMGELKSAHAADSWVKTIVIRTAVNYYHRVTKVEMLNESLDTLEHEQETGDYQDLFARIDIEVLLKLISELPVGYRSVINLSLIDGYSHKEIGDMLGIQESTSKSQLMRGKKLLIRNMRNLGYLSHERI
jgi:RNA polymerase sigma factor (sigma-70 family)